MKKKKKNTLIRALDLYVTTIFIVTGFRSRVNILLGFVNISVHFVGKELPDTKQFFDVSIYNV